MNHLHFLIIAFVKTQSIIIISALLSLLLSACSGEYNYPPVLDEINRVADDDPGRAMAMLDSVRPTLDHDDESVMIYHSLLTIKARDKAYITHTSDSAIVAVINHYENGGDPRHLPLVYYYGGRVYSDLGDAPQALDYFLKAWELLKDDNSNSKLKSVLTGQLCRLYQKQNLYKEATYFLMLSHQNDIATADTIGQIYNLTDFGLIHQKLDDLDSAMYYFRKAKDLADKFANKSSGMLCTAQLQLANGFLEMGQLDSALYYLKPIISTCNKSNQPAVYAIATSLYYDLNQLDSAEYYANEILRLGFNQGRHTAYGYLTQIEERRGNIHKSLVYMTKFRQCEDSISRTIETELIAKLNAQYNYQLRETKAQELAISNKKQHEIILYLTIGIAFVFVFSICLIQYLKRKKVMSELKYSLLQEEQERQHRLSQEYIKTNELQIQELQRQLNNITSENNNLRIILSERCAELEAKNQLAKIELKRNKEITESFTKTEIFHKLKNSTQQIESSDIEELENVILSTFPHFKVRLNTLAPKISQTEYKVCLLIKLGIKPTQISRLLCLSSESISTIRTRLYAKITGNKCSTTIADEFIKTLK